MFLLNVQHHRKLKKKKTTHTDQMKIQTNHKKYHQNLS